MSRNLIRFSIPLIGSALVAWGVVACSSDSNSPATGPSTGSGGSAGGGTGGAATGGGGGGGASSGGASSGGASGGGNTGGAAGGGDVYGCQAKPPADPVGTTAAGGDCCDTSIGKVGSCTAEADISDPLLKASYGHSGCAEGLKCAPKDAALADAGALGVYSTCTANLGANLGLEGRCLPKCFVAGNPQAPQLKQEGCSQPELVCAPCFNPLDGTATGACTQKAGDQPTTTAPTPFKTCGAYDGGPSGGTCIPQPLVDNSGNPAAGSLKQDDCASGEKCVPTLKAQNINACFAKCTTTLASFGDQYGPGACVPAYVVRDVNPAGLAILTKGTCTGDGELCAPCLDPLNAGAKTNSCE
ncbi:MAG TPA: hypothetical protein VHE30_10960 [Polyangiaceae bacterium]|nr:hypothetical protein [Polyangiaceae bacterium]